MQVVAEARDGEEALQLIRAHRPDVVLMKLRMKGLNGLEVTARVAQELPTVRVIILSIHTGAEYVGQALRAGASGYVSKDADMTELEHVIHAVMCGETVLSPTATQGTMAGGVGHRTSPLRGLTHLTPRQREVLQLIAVGHTTKEIAQQLHLSIKTVETHRMLVMRRLNIHDIAGLVRYAIRTGLIPADV
jgi:DNA-binding NarL/FixJ family response regulator